MSYPIASEAIGDVGVLIFTFAIERRRYTLNILHNSKKDNMSLSTLDGFGLKVVKVQI